MVYSPPNSKENPDFQKSSLIKLLIINFLSVVSPHDPKTKKNKNKNTKKGGLVSFSLIKRTRQNQNNYFPAAASSSVLEEGAASHPQPAAALPSALSADPSPVGDVDSAAEPSSSVEHAIDDPGDGADDNVPGGGSINSVVNELDDVGVVES